MTLDCPRCGAEIDVHDPWGGEGVTCSDCAAVLVVEFEESWDSMTWWLSIADIEGVGNG